MNPNRHLTAVVVVIVLLITLVHLSGCSYSSVNSDGSRRDIVVDDSVTDVIPGVLPLILTPEMGDDEEERLELPFEEEPAGSADPST